MPADITILFAILCAALNIFFTKGPYFFDYLEEKFRNGEKKCQTLKRLLERMEECCKLLAEICASVSVFWKKFLCGFLNKLVIAIFVLAIFHYVSTNQISVEDLDNIANISHISQTNTLCSKVVTSCDLMALEFHFEFKKGVASAQGFLYSSVLFVDGVADSKHLGVIVGLPMITWGYDMPGENADGPAKKASKRSSKSANSKKGELDSKQQLSMDEILKFFFRSDGIVTIGICRIILSHTWEHGIAGFSEVMQEFYRIYNQQYAAKGAKKSLAWMARLGQGRNSLSAQDLELFQKCYLMLPDEIRAWLAMRSVILMASPKPEWEPKEFGTNLLSRRLNRRESIIYDAGDFFGSFGQNSWRSVQAVTAFPHASGENRLSYLGHYLTVDEVDPIAVQRVSRSSNRDHLVLLAHKVANTFESGKVDPSAVLELLNAGFTAFSFEEFANLKIN